MDSLFYAAGTFAFLWVVWIIALIIAYIVGLNLVYEMAKKRGRNGRAWTLLAFFATPLVIMMYLACLGETDEQANDRIYQEEKIREKARKGEEL